MGFLVEGEARVAFTNEPGAVPQPPDNGEIKVQQADALLVSRKADGTARYTDLRPMEEQVEEGPLREALDASVQYRLGLGDTFARTLDEKAREQAVSFLDFFPKSVASGILAGSAIGSDLTPYLQKELSGNLG